MLACTRSSKAIAVEYWPATSMTQVGFSIHSRILTPLMPVEFQQHWNVPDLVTADMYGSSLTVMFRPHPPGASECTSSARQ
jgi:hypothetical protein